MQIVIDIPNWLYNAMMGHREPVYSQSLGDAVRDGIPLPEGAEILTKEAYSDLCARAAEQPEKRTEERTKTHACVCISRQAVDTLVDELARAISDERCHIQRGRSTATIMSDILDLPPVEPERNTGYCKECKYFEYNSVEKVNGIPLIVAHKICKRWGKGCKTSEDGYCFLYEPQESEGI